MAKIKLHKVALDRRGESRVDRSPQGLSDSGVPLPEGLDSHEMAGRRRLRIYLRTIISRERKILCSVAAQKPGAEQDRQAVYFLGELERNNLMPETIDGSFWLPPVMTSHRRNDILSLFYRYDFLSSKDILLVVFILVEWSISFSLIPFFRFPRLILINLAWCVSQNRSPPENSRTFCWFITRFHFSMYIAATNFGFQLYTAFKRFCSPDDATSLPFLSFIHEDTYLTYFASTLGF